MRFHRKSQEGLDEIIDDDVPTTSSRFKMRGREDFPMEGYVDVHTAQDSFLSDADEIIAPRPAPRGISRPQLRRQDHTTFVDSPWSIIHAICIGMYITSCCRPNDTARCQNTQMALGIEWTHHCEMHITEEFLSNSYSSQSSSHTEPCCNGVGITHKLIGAAVCWNFLPLSVVAAQVLIVDNTSTHFSKSWWPESHFLKAWVEVMLEN